MARLNVQKSSECGFLNVLTSTCASRHSCVCFLNISTSKSGPTVSFFVFFNILTFEFEMCFAPQRRAIFEQLNFQKFSKREPNVVCFADFDFEGSRVHFSTS